jgi:hypothetical protein
MSVLAFRKPDEGTRPLPKPIFHQPGESYSTIRLEESMAGFVKGCEFYLKHDSVYRGCTHLVNYHGTEHFGYVMDYGPLAFEWLAFDPVMPSGSYLFTEAQIVGAVVEIWSFGIGEGKPRWVFAESNTGWGNNEHLGRLLKVSVG